ncbi:MAG: sugar transferase [Lachnospiraceae bacterium]|nr:sugar transferase [Lachnospiraceae bacterium]
MYRRSIEGWAKHWDFILIDAICLQISFIFGYYLRYRDFFTFSKRNAYRTSALVLLLLSIVVAITFNTMHNVIRRSLWTEIKSTVWQCGLVFAGIVIILYSAKDSNHVSRIVMYLGMILYGITSFITRLIYKRVLIASKKFGAKRVMLLVGDEKGIEIAKAAFGRHPEDAVEIKSVVRVDGTGDVELDRAAEYIRNEWIDEVYIAVVDGKDMPHELIEACNEMAVTVHRQIFTDNGNTHPLIEKIAKQPVITTSINIPKPEQLFVKRATDIVSGFFLSLLAIITIIIATPFIKILSPGPVLLSFERIGQNGRKFKMYMIRTMYMDAADREDDKKFIKGIGAFMRRWSLDELPKGFNVLLGQMSLIGTRAPSVEEWEGYQYRHRARLACKPGITGLWQVYGGGRAMSFEKATIIDTKYINDWSMGLDLKILFAPSSLRKQNILRETGESR